MCNAEKVGPKKITYRNTIGSDSINTVKMPMSKQEIDASFNILIGKADALTSLSSIFTGSADSPQARNNALAAQEQALTTELASIKAETEKYKKAFQEKIFFKPVPVAGSLSTLQDFALAIFAVGWVLVAAVVVGAGIFQPGGSWKRGAVLGALMFILTVILQSLITSYL